MRETNLRGIDLNLLVLLDHLIAERNVTRAAAAANLSQPAMSRALARLRALLDDPILVRGAEGLVPTARARALQPALRRTLGEVRDLLAPERFDPATWRARVTISATDHQTILLLPEVIGRLAREAPGLDIDVVPLRARELDALRDGRTHLSFGVAEAPLPPGLRRRTLGTDRFVTVMRADHPAAAGSWSAADFAALDHVLVTVLGEGRGFLDAQLERLGLERRLALRLPHFYAAMEVVARSDRVVTLPETLARRFAPGLGLAVRAPPVSEVRFTPTLVWPEAYDSDPAMRWLREVIAQEAERVSRVP
ncbi:LysR substrate-binding domain-containing protein [Salinarimonas ramus]|uniref:LysR family transcriptional regulator n=1 Tax=Salinarimonas ramus TaxID=690164 RepID=A0A917QK04_9HYPH|nr:LysR substrate-binding domain-containing protein [Salinarimonas ramus]GGK52944.1 LysR family transcriptional regulator [Salinarimonas ramus]